MFDDFDENDERRNKNAFATYEEIDERQVLELTNLLDKWESGITKPWDVLLEASHITGSRPSFLIGYHVSLRYRPGTPNFDIKLQGARIAIPKRWANAGKTNLQQAQSIQEVIARIREHGGDKSAETRARIIENETQRLTDVRQKAPEGFPDLLQEDGFEGPNGYLQALKTLFDMRHQAAAEGDDMVAALVNTAIAHVHNEKLAAEWDATHMDAALERITAEGLAEHQGHIDYLTAQFRPEVMQHAPVVIEHIQLVKQKIASGEFDSWAVGQAIADILFIPAPEIKSGLSWELSDEERRPFRAVFLEGLEQSKKICEAKKKNLGKTVDLFQPETEVQIKGSLAKAFAKAAARKEAEAAREKLGKDSKGRFFGSFPDLMDDDRFENAADEEIPEFVSPLKLPDQKICNAIYITPAGAALIEPYERGEYWEAHEAIIYGDSVARITTYRVSFVPSSPKHLNALATAVEEALKAFEDIPYKYEIPGGFFGHNPSGTVYERPSERHAYVSKADGKATPHVRLDLDDLWVLYYLLEPIIEPNEQIATAMNMARYAEERGAIMDPHPLNYVSEGHEIADKSGALQLVRPEQVLEAAVRDAFVDYALNKIDEAQFMARIVVIGGHTLTGNMQDPHGRFVAQHLLPGSQKGGGIKVLNSRDILNSRVNELVRLIVGPPMRPDETILDALVRTKARITDPLREHFRSKAKADEIALGQAISRQFERNMKRWSQTDWLEEFRKEMKEGAEDEASAEQAHEENKTQLAPVTQLVVRDSEVETQMDGLYAGGRYRTKTKGSLLVRKELPSALKPFIRDQSGIDYVKKLAEPVAGYE